MTYKSAVAETGLGGGKSVILADPGRSPRALRGHGRFVDGLEGAYITAEDMNIGIPDLGSVPRTTKYGSPD